MKRILLAGLAVCALVLARERVRADQENAYDSLLGMAASAALDKGPEIGTVPEGRPGIRVSVARGASAERLVRGGSGPAASSAFEPASGEASPARKRAPGPDFEPVGASRAVPARIWTHLFASLLPPLGTAPREAFAVESSSAASRAPSAPREMRAPLEAHESGSAMGLRELVAAATAPGR